MNAIKHHEMNGEKILAMKIVLVEKIIKCSPEFQKLREMSLEEYSILKAAKIRDNFTEK